MKWNWKYVLLVAVAVWVGFGLGRPAADAPVTVEEAVTAALAGQRVASVVVNETIRRVQIEVVTASREAAPDAMTAAFCAARGAVPDGYDVRMAAALENGMTMLTGGARRGRGAGGGLCGGD